MATAAALSVRVTANISDFEKKIKSLERGLDTTGGRFQAMGTKLTAGLTLPIVAAGAAATKFAADFERSTTKLVTLSGLSTQQMQQMRQAVLDMAPAVGIGPVALSDALLVVTSTGFQGSEALQILELAAKSSAIGMGDTKDVARALTAAVSAYGSENLTAAQAADILHQTVVAGGAEATELAGELGRVVGIASQLGVSFAEVGAFIATYTRLGLSAAEATTGLSGALNTILSPSAEARKALAGIGLSADDLRRMVSEGGLGAALTTLLGRLDGNADAIGAVFGNVRALAGVMGTAGVQADAYGQALNQIKNSTGGLNAAFNETKKTFGQQWNEFKAQAERAAIAIGVQLLPALMQILQAAKPVAEMIVAMVNGFSQLPQPVQAAAIGVLALGAALGPLVFAVGTILKAGAGLVAFFRTIGLAGPASVGVTALSASTLGLAAAIGALAFALPKAIESLNNLWNIWSKFGTKALLGELGRNVNDDSKSFFKDWRVDQRASTRRKGGFAPGQSLGELAPGALATGAAAAAARQNAEDMINSIGGVTNATTKANEAASLWRKEMDRITGREAISAAQEWMRNVSAAGGFTKLTATAQQQLNSVVGDAIEAYGLLGKVAPKAMKDIWAASLAPNVTLGLGGAMPGTALDLPTAPLPPAPAMAVTQGLGGSMPGTALPLPTAPQSPSQIGAMLKNAALSGGQSVVAGLVEGVRTGNWGALGNTIKSFATSAIAMGIDMMIPGLGTILAPAIDAVVGFFGGLFNRNKGRDLVKEFAASMGGFDALHAKLLELGAAGEQMWIKLTQGVGRNNVEQAQAAISEIMAAFQNAPASMMDQAAQAGFQTTAQLQANAQQAVALWEFMRDSGQFTATAVQQAWERANDALVASGNQQAIAAQEARTQIAALDEQIKSLTQSIAQEAPEEVMGVVEQQQRAQLAALEEQRAQAQANIQSATAESAAGVQGIIDSLNGQQVVIPVRFAVNPLPGMSTPTTEAPESVTPLSSSPLSTGGVGGQGNVYLDSELVGRVMLPAIVSEAQRLGVS